MIPRSSNDCFGDFARQVFVKLATFSPLPSLKGLTTDLFVGMTYGSSDLNVSRILDLLQFTRIASRDS